MEVARFLRGSGEHPWEVDACSRLAEQDRQKNRARFRPAESSTFTSTAMSAEKRSRSFLASLAFAPDEPDYNARVGNILTHGGYSCKFFKSTDGNFKAVIAYAFDQNHVLQPYKVQIVQ